MNWNLRHVRTWQITPLPFLRYHYVKDVSCGKNGFSSTTTYLQPVRSKYPSAHKGLACFWCEECPGLILVAWRQYLCPLSGTVLIEFRNGLSDERLTAIQMHMKRCQCAQYAGGRFERTSWSVWTFGQESKCIANAYEIVHLPSMDFGHQSVMWRWKDSMTPCTNTNSEKQTSSTGFHWGGSFWEFFFFDANHRSKRMTFTETHHCNTSMCCVMQSAFDVRDVHNCFGKLLPLFILAWCEGVGSWQSKKVTRMDAGNRTKCAFAWMWLFSKYASKYEFVYYVICFFSLLSYCFWFASDLVHRCE